MRTSWAAAHEVTTRCWYAGCSSIWSTAGTTPVAEVALAWVAQQTGVSSVIPGARSPQQAVANAAAGSLPPLGEEFFSGVRALYDARLRADIHPRW
jgi:aryl-alcohol dehydrogenase-like predicted oxidoreductase